MFGPYINDVSREGGRKGLSIHCQITMLGKLTWTPTDKPVPRHFCVILISMVASDLQILEVKSPNDRLSNKQILWIGHLRALGVDAAVCHVEAVGGKRIAAPSAAAATAVAAATAAAATAAAAANGGASETAEGDAAGRGRQEKKRRPRRRRNSGDDFL